MTVESNYAVVIATLSDWFKNLVPVFQPMRSKTNSSRALSKLHVIARNSDWFFALCALVVIGWSNYRLVFDFRR